MYNKYGGWVEEGYCCSECGQYLVGLPDNAIEICSSCFAQKEIEELEEKLIQKKITIEQYEKYYEDLRDY